MLNRSASTLASFLLLFFASCGNKTSEPAKRVGSLPIKAAVIYNFGGPQPVAQDKFFLLSKDFDEIAREPGKNERDVLEQPISPTFWKPRPVGIVEDGIKPYIVSSTITDFEGNGKFENVPVGKYFLVGFTKTRKENEFLLWNLAVELKVENQTLLLSQTNAFAGDIYIPKSTSQK